MSTEKAKIINVSRINDLLRQKDLTDSKNGVSPVNILLSGIEQNLAQTGLPVTVVRGNPIVSVEDNFDNLLFPQDSVMRSGLHTLSVDSSRVLRTQMSASAVEYFKSKFEGKTGIYLFPGIVYRREGSHHQLDVWQVTRRDNVISLSIHQLMNSVLQPCIGNGDQIKVSGKDLYYIENGIKAKVPINNSLGTVFDGGQIVDEVLRKIGIDPNEYQVLAAGVSLERLALNAKKISDPRLLRSTDPRVASQMGDLKPYHLVSFMPAIIRDMSVPVSLEITPENVDSLVRTHTQEGLVESVEIVSDTPYQAVPEAARQRLGIRPEEKNLLVRVTFRSFERTLKKEEANSVRETLFEVLNHCNGQTLAELANLPKSR